MEIDAVTSLALCLCAFSCAGAAPGADRPPVAGGPALEAAARSPHGYRRNVAVLVFEGVELLDFAGPVEVFTDTHRWDEPLRVFTVGVDRRPVRTLNAVTLVPDYAVQECPPVDILVIPGGEVRCLGGDAPLGRFIHEQVPRAEIVFSVCNGVFALAEGGWLDGLEATTHWTAIGFLRKAAPRTVVHADRRFVDNGQIVTAAGISAGIDGALHIVERLLGPECARQTARRMEYEWAYAPAEPDPAADPIERARRAWYAEEWKECAEAYGSLLAQHPDDAVVLARLGTSLLFTKQASAALAPLEEAARLGSRDIILYDALGYARSRLGRHEEAVAAYSTALELDPTRLSARRGLGTELAAVGRHREAALNLQQVWDAGHGDGSMVAQLARSLAASGDREGALACARTVAKEWPEELPRVLGDPAFDTLRDDPRAAELVQEAAGSAASP